MKKFKTCQNLKVGYYIVIFQSLKALGALDTAIFRDYHVLQFDYIFCGSRDM